MSNALDIMRRKQHCKLLFELLSIISFNNKPYINDATNIMKYNIGSEKLFEDEEKTSY